MNNQKKPRIRPEESEDTINTGIPKGMTEAWQGREKKKQFKKPFEPMKLTGEANMRKIGIEKNRLIEIARNPVALKFWVHSPRNDQTHL